jgi:hypothetical protein
MGRLCRVLLAVLTLFMIAASLTGCGGGSSSNSVPVPTSIKLSPTVGSMDIGSTLQFTATATGGGGKAITFTYQSSNPAVLTFTSTGVACAGSWDSAGLVCSPGGVGISQVTATSNGVASAPVTVYVHQHIDQITVATIPTIPGALPTGPGGCFTAATTSTTTASTLSYQAVALSGNTDISSSVGPFSWQAQSPQVATVTPVSVNGVLNGQVSVTAKVPGTTQLFASIANTNSVPITFNTCAVQSIALAVASTGGTTISAAKGTSASINTGVFDISGNAISAPLTWSSSHPEVATVSTAGAVSSTNAGGTTVTASCISPTCNIGLQPPQPIYPATPIEAVYTETATTAFTVYTASTDATSGTTCAATQNCTFLMAAYSGSPAAQTSAVPLTGKPNSLVFNPAGSKIYLGSQKGLMQVDPTSATPSASTSPTTTGRVLAVSHDGNKVIVADTQSSFNQVFIADVTTPSNSVIFPISGATSAAFSPDNLKAFIGSTSPCPGSGQPACLYVYSPQAALQAIPLGTPVNDVAFLGNGMYGYLAQSSGVSYFPLCEDPSTSLASQVKSVASSAAGSAIHLLPDGLTFLTLNPPDVQEIKTSITGTPATPAILGCPLPFAITTPFSATGFLSNSSTASTPVNLGQGNFTPVAFLVATDGSNAYLLMSGIGNVLVYNIAGQTTSSIPLVGNNSPLAGALAPDGQTLFVSTNDGMIHFVNTIAGGDVQQIAVPASSLCAVPSGPSPTCLPDLLAVRP